MAAVDDGNGESTIKIRKSKTMIDGKKIEIENFIGRKKSKNKKRSRKKNNEDKDHENERGRRND